MKKKKRKKIKERIYINEWLELKPYEKQVMTDSYYLEICNKIKEKLMSNYYDILYEYLDKENINILSCFITSYFEDIISETNIWNSFIEFHKELYNKPLPFYDTKEYYEKEINEQDIRFLLWYFFDIQQFGIFINPNNQFFLEMSKDIFKIFEEKMKNAPKNKELKQYYEIDENEDDYYIARKLIDTILFKTYLFYPDTALDLQNSELKLIEKSKDDENLLNYLIENRDNKIHTGYTRLLSLAGKEWASKIIGSEHPLSKDFLNMSKKINSLFLYKGQDKNDVFIEHIASGEKFKVTKKSFSQYDKLKEIDTMILMGIVRWKEEWWFSGIYLQFAFNEKVVLEEKKSKKSKSAVNFLDKYAKKIDKILQSQFNVFKNFNNGLQIAFMPANEIDEFIKKYIEYYNNSLKLTEKQKEELRKKARKNNLLENNDRSIKKHLEGNETGLVFFNRKSGIEIAIGINSAFPLPENKYFNEQDNEEHIMRLFLSEEMSTELVMYFLDICKEKLPFLKTSEWKKLLNDIDFLLRIWKKDNYHTIPTIALV